jgi:hypothetical protein
VTARCAVRSSDADIFLFAVYVKWRRGDKKGQTEPVDVFRLAHGGSSAMLPIGYSCTIPVPPS